MLSVLSAPRWVFSVYLKRTEEVPVGTCFIISPNVAVTCRHVVFDGRSRNPVRASSVFLKTMSETLLVNAIHFHEYLDIAVLELKQKAVDHVPILFNRSAFNYAKNQFPYISLGFPENYGGHTLTSLSIESSFLDIPQITTSEGKINFIKTHSQPSVTEGFSGGPVCSQRGAEFAVMAVNVFGGATSVVSGFITSDALLDYLFQLTREKGRDFRPSHIIDWDEWCNKVQVDNDLKWSLRDRQLRYCELLGFDSPTATISIPFQGQIYDETFVYVPPIPGATEPYGFWIQQVVMPGELSGFPQRPLCNIDFIGIKQLIAFLSKKSNIQFFLPSEENWRAAVAAGDLKNFTKCGRYGRDTSRAISRRAGEPNTLGIYATPIGMYEFIDMADCERARAICAKRSHAGDLHSIEFSNSVREASVTFRLAYLALSNQ